MSSWTQHLRRYTQALIVLLGALLLSLGGVEVALRFFAPQPLTPLLAGLGPPGLYQAHPRYGWALVPHFQGPFFKQTQVQVNSLGLRDREYPPKQANELRILAQGDSYTFGMGVELQQTYSKVLESLLQQRFPQVRVAVINAGVVGYNTHHMLMMFLHLYDMLQPDMVLTTFVAANDVYENAIFAQQLHTGLKTPPGWWGYHSHAIRLLQRVWWPVQFFVANRHPRNVAYTLELLGQLQQEYARVHVPYHLLLMPARHQIVPHVHGVANLLTALGGKAILLWHNQRILAYCQAQHVPCLDLTSSLAAQAQHAPVYFTDDSHPNALGHQVMATAVAEHITPQFLHILHARGF
jgi:lysophospholipase L1-like esterase